MVNRPHWQPVVTHTDSSRIHMQITAPREKLENQEPVFSMLKDIFIRGSPFLILTIVGSMFLWHRCVNQIYSHLSLLSFLTASLFPCHLWILRAEGGQCNTNIGLIGPIKSLCNTSQRSDSLHSSGSPYKDLCQVEPWIFPPASLCRK